MPPGFSEPPAFITKLPHPWKTRIQKFGEVDATQVPPISSITGQGRLYTLLNDEAEANPLGKINCDWREETKDPNDPFSWKETLKDPKEPKDDAPKNSRISQMPPGPPSDSSESDLDSEPRKPPKIPPCSSKQPSIEISTTKPKLKNYYFNLKLKPKSVPQWNGNLDILARWNSKINRLANNFPDVCQELGKIVPKAIHQLHQDLVLFYSWCRAHQNRRQLDYFKKSDLRVLDESPLAWEAKIEGK